MKSILDKEEILNFKNLSEQIQEKNLANWGKMNAAQMFQHLNKSVEVIFTDKPIKRMFIGRIIGKMILKKAIRNSSPIDKNTPTAPTFIADNSVDFVKEKEQWLGYLAKFTKMGEIDFEGKVHPFFGKMTGHQWNALIYKHVVHHLEQFKVK